MRLRAVVAAVVLFSASSWAEASPAFARKYSKTTSVFTFMPYSGCYDPYPKLTPFGRRFKEDGFRVEDDASSLLDAVKAFPVALRTTSYTTFPSEGGSSTQGLFKGIAAGGLGSHLSFWVAQPFVADSESLDRLPI